jgi:DNA invertase Pin-like site-specific DNA recombinase
MHATSPTSTSSRRPGRAQLGIIYSRISSDEVGDELGVARHVRECQQLAASQGVTVAPEHVFIDNDRSGYRANVRRPGWDAAQALLRTGQFGNLVTKDPDRLHRQDLRVTEDLIDLLQRNDVLLVSVNSGMFDLNTVDGRERARGAAVRARAESERTSKRLRDKMADLIEQGKPNGGPRPFGYRREGSRPQYRGDADTRRLVLDPDEAPVVVEIMERVAGGQTLTAIAKDLNARGVRTSRGNDWSIHTVRNVALNGVYAGVRIHHGEEAGKGEWPAIVPEGLWRRARALLQSEDRPQRRTARRYLLVGGILRCGACGEPLRSKPHHTSKGPLPIYSCRPSTQGGCGGVTVVAERVEALVTDAVLATVESTGFAQQLRRRAKQNPQVARDMRAIERRLAEYEAMAIDGDLSPREWKRMRDGLNAKLVEAQSAMAADTTDAAVGRYAGQPGVLAEAWADMPLDRRQAIIRSVVEQVVVAPVGKATNVFDPSRVTITWRA